MVLLPLFALMTSGLASPLRSPTATPLGPEPTSKLSDVNDIATAGVLVMPTKVSPTSNAQSERCLLIPIHLSTPLLELERTPIGR